MANLGDGLLLAGLPVVASTVTTSPVFISLVHVSVFGPMLLAALPSGVAADRNDRTKLMTRSNLVRAAGLAGLALTVATGQWVLAAVYLAGVLLGTLETLSDIAAQSAVPMIVPEAALAAANSRMIGTQQVANSAVGAPVGGALATLGTGWLLGVSAVLYAAAGLVSRTLGALTPGGGRERGGSVRRDVGEGFRFLWRHPALRPIGLTNGVTNLGNSAFFGVGVLFLIGPYGLPRGAYGLALALLAAGAVIGTVMSAWAVRRLGHRAVLLVGVTTNGATYALVGLLRSPVIAGISLVVLGAAGMLWNVTNRVLRQTLTPAAMLGRVSSVMRVLALSASPLGALSGGLAAERFGLSSVTAITTLCALASLVLVLRIPGPMLRYNLDRDHLGEDP